MGAQRKISAFQSSTRLWVRSPLLQRGWGDERKKKKKLSFLNHSRNLLHTPASFPQSINLLFSSLLSLNARTHARTSFLSRHKVQNTHTATWNSKSSCPALSSGLHGYTSNTDRHTGETPTQKIKI